MKIYFLLNRNKSRTVVARLSHSRSKETRFHTLNSSCIGCIHTVSTIISEWNMSRNSYYNIKKWKFKTDHSKNTIPVKFKFKTYHRFSEEFQEHQARYSVSQTWLGPLNKHLQTQRTWYFFKSIKNYNIFIWFIFLWYE